MRRWVYVNPDKQLHADVARIEDLQSRIFAARALHGEGLEEAREWTNRWKQENWGAENPLPPMSGAELRQWWIRFYERMLIAAEQPDHAPTPEA